MGIRGPILGSHTPGKCYCCGKCCYFKEDTSSLEIYYPCRHLDQETNKCKIYEERPEMCRLFYCSDPERNKLNPLGARQKVGHLNLLLTSCG